MFKLEVLQPNQRCCPGPTQAILPGGFGSGKMPSSGFGNHINFSEKSIFLHFKPKIFENFQKVENEK